MIDISTFWRIFLAATLILKCILCKTRGERSSKTHIEAFAKWFNNQNAWHYGKSTGSKGKALTSLAISLEALALLMEMASSLRS